MCLLKAAVFFSLFLVHQAANAVGLYWNWKTGEHIPFQTVLKAGKPPQTTTVLRRLGDPPGELTPLRGKGWIAWPPAGAILRLQGPLGSGKEWVAEHIEWIRPAPFLLVALEIDSPGGDLDLASRISRGVERLTADTTVAFITGKKHRGAFSAAAMVALSCDRVYMAPSTCIGAATPYRVTKLGPVLDEKMISAISAMFRGLATKHGRSPVLAAAMVDPDIEVCEAMVGGKKRLLSGDEYLRLLFKTPKSSNPQVKLLRRVSAKGKLLTLTAEEAKSLGLIDGLVRTRAELLRTIGLGDALVLSPHPAVANLVVLPSLRPSVRPLWANVAANYAVAQEAYAAYRANPSPARALACLPPIRKALAAGAAFLADSRRHPEVWNRRFFDALVTDLGWLLVCRREAMLRCITKAGGPHINPPVETDFETEGIPLSVRRVLLSSPTFHFRVWRGKCYLEWNGDRPPQLVGKSARQINDPFEDMARIYCNCYQAAKGVGGRWR